MELFSVFFKKYSMFRAFKLNQNISAKNIFLLYKESSLCNGWLEINKMANIGIFFSISFRCYNKSKFGRNTRFI
jgi:hypothetical protein